MNEEAPIKYLNLKEDEEPNINGANSRWFTDEKGVLRTESDAFGGYYFDSPHVVYTSGVCINGTTYTWADYYERLSANATSSYFDHGKQNN